VSGVIDRNVSVIRVANPNSTSSNATQIGSGNIHSNANRLIATVSQYSGILS